MKKLKEIFLNKRKELDMSQVEFSNYLGQGKSYIAHIETDRFLPSPKVLKIFSEKFGVDFSELQEMYFEEGAELARIKTARDKGFLGFGKKPEQTLGQVPESIRCIDKSVMEHYFDAHGKPIDSYFKPLKNKSNKIDLSVYEYGFLVEDTSMGPGYPLNSVVIASTKAYLGNADLVIARPKKHEPFFRIVEISNDLYVFKALNPEYDVKVYKKRDIHFMHKVVVVLLYPEEFPPDIEDYDFPEKPYFTKLES